MDRHPRFGILVLITFSIVSGVTLLSIATYYYFRANIHQGAQADPKPLRRMLIGAVWVPIDPHATYIEPAETKQKGITTGSVKFHTTEPLEAVLSFYRDSLREGGVVTFSTTDSGATVQAISNGGRVNVQITLASTPENTTGEIHTLSHVPISPKLSP
jgi:hypothetical protein